MNSWKPLGGLCCRLSLLLRSRLGAQLGAAYSLSKRFQVAGLASIVASSGSRTARLMRLQ
eukprot:7722983-Prorocentrum_lima.AAC.1